MLKVFYTNLNVGSAIEYSGNIFRKELEKIEGLDIFEYKNQDNEIRTFNELLQQKPDIILINSLYPRITRAVSYYLELYPDTNVVVILRTFEEMKEFVNPSYGDDRDNTSGMQRDLLKKADYIIPINLFNRSSDEVRHFSDKIIRGIGFCDKELFPNSVEWKKRPKKYCSIGSLNSHKVSEEFLRSVRRTNFVIDMYGTRKNQSPLYREIFDQCENINYMGEIPQEDVGKVLNLYKYYILPHNGYEPLCNSLMQAISCGTIPLVVNNRESKSFDPRWIDWAEGLYFGCNTVDELLKNMRRIEKDNEDLTSISKHISSELHKKYDYKDFIQQFKDIFEDYINTYDLSEDIK